MFRCHVCGSATAKTELVSEVFTIDGRRVLVERIPAMVGNLRAAGLTGPSHENSIVIATKDIREITLTLYDRTSGGGAGEKRTFVFADAYPVRWLGPSIHGDTPGSWAAWEETLEIAHSGLRLSS